MSSPKFKVTDKRMFTPEGELKEEYRFLEEEKAQRAAQEEPPAAPPQDVAPPPQMPPEPAATAQSGGPGMAPEAEEGDGPSFLDLVMMLAEPATIYLGEARLPDGSRQENLPLAGLHIELLEVLRRKSQGNLTPQEAAVLEDVLYQLKTRYVRKQG